MVHGLVAAIAERDAAVKLKPMSAVRFASLLGAALISSATCQEQTTATYGDWTLQCEVVQAGPPARKSCDIWQIAQVQGHPVTRVEIGHPVRGQPVRLAAQVSVNVSLRGGVRLHMSDTDPGLAAAFNRCVPAGCFAEFELSADALRKFRGVGGGAKLTFTNAIGQRVSVPVSFKGFAPAFDALSNQ
jgi:invasion protein IalB